MTCKKWFLIEIVFFLVFLTFNSKVYSGNPSEIASLRGLRGVLVLVENLPPEIEGEGLTREQIQTDVELKLRLAGIKVFSKEDSLTAPMIQMLSQVLCVNADVMIVEPGRLAVYTIRIEFRQPVLLKRDPKIEMFTATWQAGLFGTVGIKRIDKIRNSIKDMLDIFINEFLSVNPKGGN